MLPLPYAFPILATELLVSAYELTGCPATMQHIDELLGWLVDHQQAPPEGDPVTGAWTHSWQAHEGESYDPATDVRGASPWMSANIVGGLWRAWLVTHDERIPVMLRDFSHYRSEDRRFAKECVMTCRYRCEPDTLKKKQKRRR